MKRTTRKKHTFWPLSINLTAKSSLVNLSLTSLATPKFPDPIAFKISYRSIVSKTPKEDHPKQSLYLPPTPLRLLDEQETQSTDTLTYHKLLRVLLVGSHHLSLLTQNKTHRLTAVNDEERVREKDGERQRQRFDTWKVWWRSEGRGQAVWEGKENSFPETNNRLATAMLTTEHHYYTPKLGGMDFVEAPFISRKKEAILLLFSF